MVNICNFPQTKKKDLTKFSLRTKIFLSMISLVLLSSILMAITTILHYKNENQNYHHKRIERKENRLLTHIYLILKEHPEISSRKDASLLIKERISELSTVHNLAINVYNMDGSILVASDSSNINLSLEEDTFEQLYENSIYIKTIKSSNILEQTNLLSYSYIKFNNENLAILYLPYTQENTIYKSELENLLISFAELYVFMLIGAVVSAFFVSRYITLSLKKISLKLNRTDLRSNEPFTWNSNDEIGKLVSAYNVMVNKLEESAALLVKSEREHAWREMAKQVAHEIKNPLTPMRLEVQMLERNAYKMERDSDQKKILDFSKGMILQIDTLSRIANEFSNFAKMPIQQLKQINFSEFAIKFSKLHSHSYIDFNIRKDVMNVLIDEKQFSRVLNNLLKNAEQSIPNNRIPKVVVDIELLDNNVEIRISDNGKGISDKEKTKIFEPQFTTKTGGMGLGLGISKNIIESLNGKIRFDSQLNIGTTFYIDIPTTNNQ